MTSARLLPRLVLAAFLLAALCLAASATRGGRSAAAPADALDWPERLSVGPANDVAVDMQTDTLGAMVVRVAPDGDLLARWANDGPAIDIAAGVDGMVYTVMWKSNRVYKYAPDGTRLTMWQERNPLAVAAGPYGEAAGGSVYVLACEQGIGEPRPGPREVTRYTAEGRQVARWVVSNNAYDLALVPTNGAPDGTLVVAEGDPLGGGTSVLAHHALDGTLLGRSSLTAAAIGLGANGDGEVYTVLKQKDVAAGFVSAYRDGVATGTGWRLPAGEPKDLAVDPGHGDVYVIVDDYTLRYSRQGTLLGRITREQLNGRVGTVTPATPTPTSPATAGPTSTRRPTDTPMPTATIPGATDTPVPTRLAYLPLAARGAAAGRGAAGRPVQSGAVVPHELIAQEGGAIRAMRADGDRLWMGHGPRLVALDASNPTARVVGRSPVLGGSVRDLAIGSLAPNATGGDPGVAWVLVTGDRLVGVNVRDPEQLAPLGSTELSTDTDGIALVGDHLWAADAWGDLVGFNVSDPRAPSPAGRLAGALSDLDVRALGAIPGHLVVATSGYGTSPTPVLHVFDVRDPTRPVRVGGLPRPVPGDWLVTAAFVDVPVAWLVGGYPVQLIAVDLRTPATPAILSRLNLADSDVYSARSLLVSGGRAYLIGGDYGHNYFTAAVIDVTYPAAPRFLGSHVLPRSSDPTGGMAVTGGRFWYATRDGRLFAVDAGQPVAGLPVVGDTQTIGPAEELNAQSDYGLLSLGEALLTLDRRRPEAPRPLATTLLHHYPGDAAVVGNTALVVCQGEMDVLGGELHVLDVSDPGAPRPLAELFRNLNPETIAVSGTLGVMLADRGDGTFWNRQAVLLDLADPAAPTRLGMVEDRAGFQDVALFDRLLLSAGPERISLDPTLIKLVVADIADPAAPRRLGDVTLAGPIPEFAVVRLAPAGRYVYLAASGRGADYWTIVHQALHVVDITEPARPAEVAELPLAGEPSAIRYAHGWIFVATTAGVRVFDVSEPARPREAGVLPSGADPALDVRVRDGLVYVSASDGGLYVFYPRLSSWPPLNLPPTSTTPPATASPSPGTATATPRAPTATPSATATSRPRWHLFLPYGSRGWPLSGPGGYLSRRASRP